MRLKKIGLMALSTLLLTVSLFLFPKSAILFSAIQVRAQTSDPRKAEADRLFELGFTALQNGQLLDAFQSLQQALKIYRENGFTLEEANTLGNLGVIARARGKYTEAIEYLERVLQIMRDLGNPKGEWTALGQLGLVNRALGNYDRAKQLLLQQLDLSPKVGTGAEMSPLNDLGLIYFDLREYDKAIANFQRQLTLARQLNNREMELKALQNMGLVYETKGDFDRAVSNYEQVLEAVRGDRTAEGYVLGNLGLVYLARGDFKRAIESLQRYVESTKRGGDRRQGAVALNNLGVAFMASGKFAEAEKVLFESIEIRESLRQGLDDANKVSIFETQNEVYGNLQNVLLEQKKIPEALEVAERGRARAFVELLAAQLSPQSAITQTITKPSFAEIQKIAQTQKATLVEYSIVYKTYHGEQLNLLIWVVKPTGEVTYRQVKLDDISMQTLVFDTLQYMGARGRGDEQALKPGDFVRMKGDAANLPPKQIVNVDRENNQITLKLANDPEDAPLEIRRLDDVGEIVSSAQTTNRRLEQLHQLLVEPIADLLPSNPNDRVIFIPQKELFLVPFPALRDKAGKSLIEKHTILTAPAIQVLSLTRQQRAKVQKVALQDAIVVGNPTMPEKGQPPQKLSPLPEAEKEALAIAPLLNTQALIGDRATKNAILQKLSKARWIHLATHGTLDDARGLGSAIALAPGNNDNGFLTAEEILNLNLNAELVVLSACNTGKGRITGDGVIGLSRSLISAGVPSVIVSLWQVPDAPTAELMTQFYQNLKQNPDKAQALRNAMLATMQQHPDPKDWAAFTLIGEAE